MSWENSDLLTVLAVLPVVAVMLIGPLSRWRPEALPQEFRGLVDAADNAERELVEELRSFIRLVPF